jgi:RNA polymerase sigma-70 factor (ECF subfamily)
MWRFLSAFATMIVSEAMNSRIQSDRADLLHRAQKGDEGARGALLETYRNYLELLARIEIGRRLQTKVDADDLVQETFLEAHRNFGLFRGREEPEFVAWLRAILATRLADLLRHFLGTQGRDIRRERDLQIDLDQSSRALDRGLIALHSTPSQQLARQELKVMFADTLAQLSEEYREVIVLRHFEELSFADVALRMNRSIDSVQKLWVRGLARLRQLVGALP